MGKFTQDQETMIVKNAMELTALIMVEEQQLQKIQAERFREVPNGPNRTVLALPQKIQPKYPPKPKTTYKFGDHIKSKGKDVKISGIIITATLLILLIATIVNCARFGFAGIYIFFTLFFFMVVPAAGVAVLLTFIKYRSKCSALNKELEQTPQYLEAVQQAEMEASKKQQEAEEAVRKEQEKLDAEYENKLEHYNKVILPEYNNELAKWSAVKERKITFLKEELQLNNESLNDLYENSKIISVKYRELWMLKWIYEDMSSSDHDIRYSTELLDRERQLDALQNVAATTQNAIMEMQETMMSGFDAVYDAISYGNDLQEESVSILSKTRRDNNISNLVGTVQRHKSNKMLSSLIEKK